MSEYEPAAPVSSSGPSGPRSSFGRRLVAYLIDGILLTVLELILLAILDDSLAYALTLVAGFLYFGYFEGSASGQTLGKRAVGIRVIDFNTGGPIGFPRGLLRYLGKILSTIAIFIGFLWMLWDREKQCWQDKIANTVVVPVSAYPVS
jgi:uncharacterized RDD family membrane protein YckC